MRVALLLGAATLSVGAAHARPDQHDSPQPRPPQKVAQVILASADPAKASEPGSPPPTSAPTKRPVARVTTCRCGDAQPEPENPEQ